MQSAQVVTLKETLSVRMVGCYRFLGCLALGLTIWREAEQFLWVLSQVSEKFARRLVFTSELRRFADFRFCCRA
jgi:hypothetical protein